jgi:hypothetical protein
VKKQGNNDVASWKVAKFAPRDRQKFSVTLLRHRTAPMTFRAARSRGPSPPPRKMPK